MFFQLFQLQQLVIAQTIRIFLVMKVFAEFSGFSMKKSNPLVVALSQHITDKCVITGSNTPGINVRATALINGKNS
jgi:hypothetical protein